jgi:hypothetical protein
MSSVVHYLDGWLYTMYSLHVLENHVSWMVDGSLLCFEGFIPGPLALFPRQKLTLPALYPPWLPSSNTVDNRRSYKLRCKILAKSLVLTINLINWKYKCYDIFSCMLLSHTVYLQFGHHLRFVYMSLSLLDMFSVMMAACSSDCDAEDRVAECLNILIEKGAKINSHDRYGFLPFSCRKLCSRISSSCPYNCMSCN